MDTTQLLKGVLDVAVLAVVADQDGYGYDVVRRLRTAGRLSAARCLPGARCVVEAHVATASHLFLKPHLSQCCNPACHRRVRRQQVWHPSLLQPDRFSKRIRDAQVRDAALHRRRRRVGVLNFFE